MGNSSPRQITIENDRDVVSENYNSNEGKGKYKSDKHSKSSSSDKTSSKDDSRGLPTDLMTEEEFQQLKSLYDQKIATLQNKNARLYGATIENFGRGVERVEEKYLKALKPPVCGDLQAKMICCFRHNKDQILKCGSDVDSFNACMQQYRISVS